MQGTLTQLALAMWAALPTAMPQSVKFTGLAAYAILSWTPRMQLSAGVPSLQPTSELTTKSLLGQEQALMYTLHL